MAEEWKIKKREREREREREIKTTEGKAKAEKERIDDKRENGKRAWFLSSTSLFLSRGNLSSPEVYHRQAISYHRTDMILTGAIATFK